MGDGVSLVGFVVSAALDFYLVAAVMVLSHCFLDIEIVWNTEKKKMLLCLSLLNEVICRIWDHPIATIAMMAVYLLFFSYGSEKKMVFCAGKAALVLLYLLSCFMMLSDIGACFILMDYSLMDFHEIYYNIIGLVIFVPLYYFLTFRFLKHDSWIPFRKREKWQFLFYWLYIFSFYLLLLLMQEDRNFTESILQTAFIVTMLVFSLGLPIYILQNRVSGYYKDRQDYQEIIMQAELSYFQQYKEKQKETGRFRHDIRNHLLCLQMMLEQEKEEEAREYLDNLLANVSVLSPEIVTGDEMLDCILSVKLACMKQTGISFSLDGILECELSWKPIDLCVVFANAMDNAIEACNKIPAEQERKIQLEIRKTERYYCIEIRNTVCAEEDYRKLLYSDTPVTSKPNQHLHGFGMQNMKRTMEKYGGFLQIDYQECWVTVSFMIPRLFTTGE